MIDGKLTLTKDGRLPIDPQNGLPATEWTTAILQNDLVGLGLKSNWYGTTLEEFTRGNKSLAASLEKKYPELASGILGTVENSNEMTNAVFEKSRKVLIESSVENLFYSFGTDYPGAMTLHNYPHFLRNMNLSSHSPFSSEKVDLATRDIVRDRERGIPRYNEFRRLLHLTPKTTFEESTPDKDRVTELRRVYNEDVEAVDLLIGSLAENPLPKGFGFSDTFFRIFLVMGRRRLEADRFFTDDYTPELYTQWSLDYIDQTFF